MSTTPSIVAINFINTQGQVDVDSTRSGHKGRPNLIAVQTTNNLVDIKYLTELDKKPVVNIHLDIPALEAHLAELTKALSLMKAYKAPAVHPAAVKAPITEPVKKAA